MTIPCGIVAAGAAGSDGRGAAQTELDECNAEFWNTLCGTTLAVQLGIHDHSAESLRKFDEWYFAFYPYLAEYIPFAALHGQRVLEIGLGYGTVSQRLAEAGADYTGLDIAQGPVDMVNYRLQLYRLPGQARRGSILAAPFADDSFDCVVAIGCYHHTGDLPRAFDESYRLLRPGGLLVAMVYNAYSYRRWLRAFAATARYLLWETCGIGAVPLATAADRGRYDRDPAGRPAPHTDFISRRHLRRLCGRYREFRAMLANIDREMPFLGRSRAELLGTAWPRRCGLDIYLHARK
jgi:SAM-dependent methyltransferase